MQCPFTVSSTFAAGRYQDEITPTFMRRQSGGVRGFDMTDRKNGQSVPTQSGTILVVDDNANNRDMCKIYLEIEGYTIYTAEDGEQGLKSASEILPDLILLDIMMPVMDGYQMLVRLKADPDLNSLPVLVLTVQSDTEDVVKALRLGANDYLKKPFDVDELIARVHTLITLKQTQDSLRLLTDNLRTYQHDLESELERRTRESKALQKKIFQNQKLEALGTLAGGIAHDFKNILFLIIGYVEMTVMNLSDDTESVENLEQALSAARRAKSLIDNIHMFSRQADTERKPTNIQHVIIDVLKMIRSSIPPAISIEQTIDMECGAVMCSPDQMHQMIVNLCTNACHAMPENAGTLKVGLQGVHLHPANILGRLDVTPGKYVHLYVSDTGGGMPAEVMDKIFDPYFTTKPDLNGTGLGLSVVHGIVKSHDGDMAVESEVGKGTTFHVYLPQMQSAFFSTDKASAALSSMIPGNADAVFT